MIRAVASVVLALLVCGGIWGTLAALKSSRGPQERAFVKRICLMCWTGFIFSVFGLLFVPSPWKFFIGILYVLQIARSFLRWKRRRAELRAEDAAAQK